MEKCDSQMTAIKAKMGKKGKGHASKEFKDDYVKHLKKGRMKE